VNANANDAPASVVVPDCDSPFFVDTQGIRRVRPECL
jgi:hypothetical protein